MTAGRPGWAALARDAACVTALAVLTVQVLRREVGDRYLVPTGSMEPVLHGDPRAGDVVFVDKLARASARRRHDLVVVLYPPDSGVPRVKRIAASGDDADACYVDLRDGDVWLGPDPQRLRREQKDPLDARGQRVPWAEAPDGGASERLLEVGGAREPWPRRLPAAVAALPDARRRLHADVRAARRAAGGGPPDGFWGSAVPVHAGFVDATGAVRTVGADVPVGDAGMELACGELRGELLATVETRHGALTFHWQPASGRVGLWRDGEDVAAVTLPAAPAPTSIAFGLLDDRVWFCLDGARERLWVVPRDESWRAERPGPVRTSVHAGVVGPAGAGVTVRAVRVFHDVHAYREPVAGVRGQPSGWPRFVPPGHWFLLGDSAFDSHDSRQFGPVPASSFVGVPRFVLGPWPRQRWVQP